MMLYLRMSACWLEHTRLQMIERVRELRCQSFRSPRRPPKSERKGRKKCAQKWAPSPIHASRVTTRKARKEIQSKTFRVAHFRVAVHSHAFASVSFAPSLFHRAKPFTAAKKKVGRIILREKKIGIQRQNDRVPCSSALGVVFRVRPPYVCKSHDECECERCSKQSALYRCFCVGFLEFLKAFLGPCPTVCECLGFLNF